ncbi:MAG: hypothetical protein U9P42_00275 [Candidatus Fermentibacteria bacterium]|nr:hypothetical protein [Candidatus Fermentibacteria bacterium]
MVFKNIPGSFTEKILCSISELVIIYDSNIRVVWVSPSAELFFGHSTEFLAGKKCTDIFHGLLECFDNCPVARALISGDKETLVVDGILTPRKLIEAASYNEDGEQLVLAIVHSVPQVDRNKALRRDFAALLNQSATLQEAAHTILNAMQTLTSVQACGIYDVSGNEFKLLLGTEVPDSFNGPDFESPCYLSAENLPFNSDNSFPDGAAFIPVPDREGKTRILLLAGRGTMGSRFRNKLEMIGSVLESCVNRLTSPL